MKIKKKLKKFGKGGQNPPIITKDKNDPRIQAYQDSLDLHNYSLKGGEYFKNKVEPLIKQGKTEEATKKWNGSNKGSFFTDTESEVTPMWNRLKKLNKEAPEAVRTGSKYDSMFGYNTFTKPVQPIIYQPEENNTPPNPTNYGMIWQRQPDGRMTLGFAEEKPKQRPKEQPINIQSAKPDLLHTHCPECEEWSKLIHKPGGASEAEVEQYNKLYPQYGNIETVPFKKGSYFTTNDDQQENAGLRYWDKKTGRQLKEFGGQIQNELDMTKKKIKKYPNGGVTNVVNPYKKYPNIPIDPGVNPANYNREEDLAEASYRIKKDQSKYLVNPYFGKDSIPQNIANQYNSAAQLTQQFGERNNNNSPKGTFELFNIFSSPNSNIDSSLTDLKSRYPYQEEYKLGGWIKKAGNGYAISNQFPADNTRIIQSLKVNNPGYMYDPQPLGDYETQQYQKRTGMYNTKPVFIGNYPPSTTPTDSFLTSEQIINSAMKNHDYSNDSKQGYMGSQSDGSIRFKDGGKVNMAKNGKKIKMKLKKAEIGVYNQEDPTFNVGDQGYNEQAQYNPVTGEKFNQFNPSLTFGLQNYYQSKGKNAPAYLSPEEGSQYADYVNTQPKQQNVNNNTFSNNVAPYLPTQGLFNNFYLNKADRYRKQAINSFSNIGQAKYGKQIPQAEFGFNNGMNLGSGISNAVLADINTAKGYTDIFGSLKMNSQIAQIEAQNKRQNLFSQFENPAPTFQNGWGGNNALDNGYIPVGEYGKVVKNFENTPKNKHNIEYQGGEGVMIPTEKGYISDYVNSSIKHEDYNPDSATEKGISTYLPEGSYVIPGKEISLKEAILPNKKGILELKQLKTKKAAANVLKPYLDTSMQETLSKDKYSENSKRLHNELSQPILIANTEKIEQDKLDGVFGEKVKNSAMKDYQMKNGGSVLPETAKHGKSLRGTGKDVENNFKDLDEAYKNYKKNGYTGAKDITQMREWSYNKDPQGVSAYIERTRPTNEHIRIWKEKYSKTEPVNISKMNPEDRFAGYNDKLWDYRAFKFNDVPTVNNLQKTQQPAVQQSSTPGTIPSLQAEKLNRLKGFNPNITALQLPDAYVKDPITVNNLQPEFYQPNTITPYLNDIQRLQYTTNTNLGTSGADLASRANSFGQGLTEYYKRLHDASTYNAGVKTQASKDNALTKLNTNQFNNSNYINNARNPQLQREAVITEQKRMDREAQLKTFADKEHEQNVNNYLQTIYDPSYALNANYISTKKVAKYGTKLKLKKKK